MNNIIIPFHANLLESGSPPFANTKSLSFDGVDDVVVLGSGIPLNASSSNYSLSVWFRSNSYAGTQVFLTDSSIATKFISIDLNNSIRVRIDALSVSYAVPTMFIGIWYNVVLTVNSGVGRLYLNGVESTSGSQTINQDWVVNSINGYAHYHSGGYDLIGLIDEVCFLDRVVTPTEIATLSTAPTVDLTDLNPIAWYRNGDNGSWKSPQWLIPNNENKDKVSNYSMAFDGVDDYLTTNALSSLVDNKAKLSISFWVNLPNASEINRISGKYLSLNKWLAIGGNLNTISFVVSGTSTSPSQSQAYGVTSAVLTNNTWQHIVCVFDGTQAVNNDRVKIYVDNVDEILTYNASFPDTTYDFSTDASPPNWLIGQNGIQLGTNELRGMLDEYAIYSNVALTSVEVSEIYNSGVPNDLSTLTVTPDLWYKMGENSTFLTNWTVPDEVGANDGTSANMTIEDRIGEAPSSENNAVSLNMDFADVVPDTP